MTPVEYAVVAVVAGLGLGLSAVAGWLAVAGLARRRRRTPGGRRAIAAGVLLAPLAATLLAFVTLVVWMELAQRGGVGEPPDEFIPGFEFAMTTAPPLFALGQIFLALAGRAALAAADRRPVDDLPADADPGEPR